MPNDACMRMLSCRIIASSGARPCKSTSDYLLVFATPSPMDCECSTTSSFTIVVVVVIGTGIIQL